MFQVTVILYNSFKAWHKVAGRNSSLVSDIIGGHTESRRGALAGHNLLNISRMVSGNKKRHDRVGCLLKQPFQHTPCSNPTAEKDYKKVGNQAFIHYKFSKLTISMERATPFENHTTAPITKRVQILWTPET